MAWVIPNEGEVQLLTDLLGGGSLENWSLRLFKSNTTPAETDTAATYTVADFTGYTSKTLTRTLSGATWATPASGSPTNSWSAEASVAESAYGASAQTWTNSGATPQTIYGYILVGATSTKLIGAETFAASRTLNQNDVLNLTPRFGLS